jgi:hypothetical protein
METPSKLARIDSRRQSPLTAELKEFIDRAIVPALVRQYLVETDSASTPEKHIGASTWERRVDGR